MLNKSHFVRNDKDRSEQPALVHLRVCTAPGRCPQHLAGAAVARACLHRCQPRLGPVWVHTRDFYGCLLALGGLLAIETVITSPRAGHKPHRGEKMRLLVPTTRKVLASTIITLI